MANWLPGTREGQLNIAKVWAAAIQTRGSAWGIPAGTQTELQTAITDADTILQTALSANRTPAITTRHCPEKPRNTGVDLSFMDAYNGWFNTRTRAEAMLAKYGTLGVKVSA